MTSLRPAVVLTAFLPVATVSYAQGHDGVSLRGGQLERYELAQQVPGFAGFRWNDDSTVTVFLSRPEQAALVSGPMEALLARRRDALGPEAKRAALPRLKFERVDHDYRELGDWFNTIKSVTSDTAVTEWSISEIRNRVIIGVKTESDVSRIRKRILDFGVPANGFVVELAPGFVLRQSEVEIL